MPPRLASLNTPATPPTRSRTPVQTSVNIRTPFFPRAHNHLFSPWWAAAPAGKVVDRHWYNKNKHIFPASHWAVYDPDKAIQGLPEDHNMFPGGK